MTANSGPTAAAGRTPTGGDVDFTLMYVAHDAFSRDLDRLLRAAEDGAWSAADHIRWHTFTRQLHVHHHAEDDALWPPLRAGTLSADEVATLDAMEAEHARIDPMLEQVERDVAAGDPAGLTVSLGRLRAGLAGHMRHACRCWSSPATRTGPRTPNRPSGPPGARRTASWSGCPAGTTSPSSPATTTPSRRSWSSSAATCCPPAIGRDAAVDARPPRR